MARSADRLFRRALAWLSRDDADAAHRARVDAARLARDAAASTPMRGVMRVADFFATWPEPGVRLSTAPGVVSERIDDPAPWKGRWRITYALADESGREIGGARSDLHEIDHTGLIEVERGYLVNVETGEVYEPGIQRPVLADTPILWVCPEPTTFLYTAAKPHGVA